MKKQLPLILCLLTLIYFGACDDTASALDKKHESSNLEESSESRSDDTGKSNNESSGKDLSSSSESESSSSANEKPLPTAAWKWDVSKELRLNPNIEYDSIKDPRDGQSYKVIKIGDMTWMAENLNYYDKDNLSLKDKSKCYDTDVDEKVSCAVVGRHYTWAAAIDSVKLATDANNPLDCGNGKECGLTGKVRGICPPGWHLPSEAEWKDLISFVGNNSTTGKDLKTQSGWMRDGKQGTDTYGFSALPAGYISEEGYADAVGARAYFWSSTEICENGASFMSLFYDKDDVSMRVSCGYEMTKDCGISVRCIKDAE